jgi:hypothetical protein
MNRVSAKEPPQDTYQVKKNSDGMYVGQIEGNKRNGLGMLMSTHDVIYEGLWINNSFEGLGIQIHQDGRTYLGEHRNWKKFGLGKLNTPERQIVGNFNDNKMNGVCLSNSLENNNLIFGNYANDKLHGFGVIRLEKLEYEFKGFFRDNKIEGVGIENKQGNFYQGEFVENRREGVGLVKMRNERNEYVRHLGWFKKGIRVRFGIEKTDADTLYEGDFQDDQKIGICRLTSMLTGTQYIGDMYIYKKTGFGRFEDKDGYYIGGWKDDKKEGLGFRKEKDRIYFGFWRENQREGLGYEFGPDYSYRGEFLSDKPHGRGIIKTANSKEARCVMFTMGNLLRVTQDDPDQFLKNMDQLDFQLFSKYIKDKIRKLELYIEREKEELERRFSLLEFGVIVVEERNLNVSINALNSRIFFILDEVEKNRARHIRFIEKNQIDVKGLEDIPYDSQSKRSYPMMGAEGNHRDSLSSNEKYIHQYLSQNMPSGKEGHKAEYSIRKLDLQQAEKLFESKRESDQGAIELLDLADVSFGKFRLKPDISSSQKESREKSPKVVPAHLMARSIESFNYPEPLTEHQNFNTGPSNSQAMASKRPIEHADPFFHSAMLNRPQNNQLSDDKLLKDYMSAFNGQSGSTPLKPEQAGSEDKRMTESVPQIERQGKQVIKFVDDDLGDSDDDYEKAMRNKAKLLKSSVYGGNKDEGESLAPSGSSTRRKLPEEFRSQLEGSSDRQRTPNADPQEKKEYLTPIIIVSPDQANAQKKANLDSSRNDGRDLAFHTPSPGKLMQKSSMCNSNQDESGGKSEHSKKSIEDLRLEILPSPQRALKQTIQNPVLQRSSRASPNMSRIEGPDLETKKGDQNRTSSFEKEELGISHIRPPSYQRKEKSRDNQEDMDESILHDLSILCLREDTPVVERSMSKRRVGNLRIRSTHNVVDPGVPDLNCPIPAKVLENINKKRALYDLEHDDRRALKGKEILMFPKRRRTKEKTKRSGIDVTIDRSSEIDPRYADSWRDHLGYVDEDDESSYQQKKKRKKSSAYGSKSGRPRIVDDEFKPQWDFDTSEKDKKRNKDAIKKDSNMLDGNGNKDRRRDPSNNKAGDGGKEKYDSNSSKGRYNSGKSQKSQDSKNRDGDSDHRKRKPSDRGTSTNNRDSSARVPGRETTYDDPNQRGEKDQFGNWNLKPTERNGKDFGNNQTGNSINPSFKPSVPQPYDPRNDKNGGYGKGWDDYNGPGNLRPSAGPNDRYGRDGLDGKQGKDGRDGYGPGGLRPSPNDRYGRDGSDGKAGFDGKDGRDGYGPGGLRPSAGPNDRYGRDGLDGKQGKDGRDGYGPGGLRPSAGPNDRDGRDGKAGFDGKDGRDGYGPGGLRPSAGPNDRDGRDGKAGFDGKDGRDGYGPGGLRPSAGPNDRDGRDGKAGFDGKDGRDGYGPGGLRPSAGPNDRDGRDGKAGFDGKDGRDGYGPGGLRPSAGPNDRDGREGKAGFDGKMVETATDLEVFGQVPVQMTMAEMGSTENRKRWSRRLRTWRSSAKCRSK